MRNWQLVAHVGDHPALQFKDPDTKKPKRAYFPHIHVNCDNLDHDKQFRSSDGHLMPSAPHTLTINEVGDQNGTGPDGYGQQPFDELARLLAAAPDLYAACQLAQRLFTEALPQFDWGASALNADAIRLLNEVPGVVAAALAKAEGR